MENERYNGWTNYETWRVHLEFFDGFEPETREECSAENLKDMLGEHIAECAPPLGGRDGGMNLAADWAMSFAERANYREIGEHLLADHFPDLVDEEEEAAA